MNDYLAKLRPMFSGKTDAELELLCSASRSWQKVTGLSAETHRRRGMEKLFPSRVWHEWRDQRMNAVQECLSKRIQIQNWIGSTNSNKTGDLSDIALTLWWTKPEMTSIYVTSPYESATETGIWAEIQDQFEEAKRCNPGLPGEIRRSQNAIILYDRNPRSFIRVTTVDKVGKLVGKKSRDFSQGMLVLILDEAPAFSSSSSAEFMRVLPNLIGVPNLLILTAGNFAHTWDLLGLLCDPVEEDVPGGYDGFDADKHFKWRNKRGGITLRFDGLLSPNVKAGKDIYPFLTTIDYVAKMAAMPGGLESPEAMRFVRSAPVTSLDAFTITSSERIRGGGAYDAFEWTGDPIKLGAFMDAGFGGDPCVIQKFKLGNEKLPSGGRRQILSLWDAPFTIPIKVGVKDAAGREIPVEEQVARGAMKYSRAQGIPDDNFGYDGSMRAGLAQAMSRVWTNRVQAIDSGGKPTDRKVSAGVGSKTWNEVVDRFVSELWFSLASLIDSFQLKGLQQSPKAATQLTTRRWEWSGGKGKGKRRIQTKQEYRDMMSAQGRTAESPNEADALVGCVEMARRMGLSLEGVTVAGGSLELVLDLIRASQMATQMRQTMRRELSPGKLNSSRRQMVLPSGRLNR
jgi:hypothetical protein